VFFYAYNKIITAKKINKYIHLTIGIGWIATHYSWFFYYSSHFSPYLGAPDENYGVFRYFFIFWILIDILFLMTISVYFKFYNNKSAILSPLESTIQVKRGNKKVFLKIDSIYWISADGYYINIHSNQGQFLLRRALKDIFESLPKSNFIKIHRSAIININYLQELQQAPNKKLSVQMQDGNSHAVSKTHAKNLKDILKSTSV
jgi:DNA-binding LytR/AlgR family response regulator